MLDINEITQYYPEPLRIFKRFILREYLQYKILEIIFNGPYNDKLSFLGGTCLRIIHNNQRFSEDLDFDNFNLNISEFADISENIRNELQKSGYLVETKMVAKGAYHCYISFPNLLFHQGLSGYFTEKILIQLDTEAQNFNFEPEHPIINKFDVFTRIVSTPLNLLMAQKCYAILNRPRNKGRDFYDMIFLMGKNILPDLKYLNQKLNITTSDDLKNRLIKRCETLNMVEMSKDVAPFLFNPLDTKKIGLFKDYLFSYSFDK